MSASSPVAASGRQDTRTDAAIEAEMERVFERPEFDDTPSMLDRLFDWIAGLLDVDIGSGVATDFLLIVLAALFLVVAILVGVHLTHALRAARSGADGAQVDPVARARARARELRAEARAAYAGGDRRSAVRFSFWALVVGLGARGELEFRDAWTNRELVRRGRPPQELGRLLESLVEEYEAKDFGLEPTTDADVERMFAVCEELLGPLEVDSSEVAA